MMRTSSEMCVLGWWLFFAAAAVVVDGSMDICNSGAGARSPACRDAGRVASYSLGEEVEAAENEFIQGSWDNFSYKEELAPITGPFGQSVATVMVAAWRLFGAELTVFVATVIIAMIMRGPKFAKASPSSPQPFSHSPATATKVPAAQSAAAISARREERQRLDRLRRRLEVPSGQQEAARLLDGIVDLVRSNSNVRAACHALEMYQDLRDTLKKADCSLAEATWHSRHSAFDMYSILVQCAARSSKCHLVVCLLDDMVAQGVSRPLSFYESTMKQLAGQKHYQLALNVYDRLAGDGLTASAVTCSCLVSFATEVGEYDRAIEFFSQLAQCSTPSIRAYMTVLRVHNKRQDWESSSKIFRQMRERNAAIDSLVLNVVLSTGVAADKLEEVDALIVEGGAAKPKMIDVVSYNTLIKGFIQRSDLNSAIGCLERMKSDGIKPNCITFNTMMDRAMRSLQEDKAWLLYRKMGESGVKPDRVTCSILVKGLGKKPQREQLESCLQLLEQASSFCDGAFLANLHTFVIDAAARSGETDVLATAQQMHLRCSA